MADKAEVPKPSRLKRGQKLVPVPLWIVGKLALYWAVREIGVSQSELARRLNVRETVVRRMLDPSHDTRPEKIQAALEVLGKRIVMAYDDAACPLPLDARRAALGEGSHLFQRRHGRVTGESRQ